MDIPRDIKDIANSLLGSYKSEKGRLRRPEKSYRAAATLIAAYQSDYPLRISEVADHFNADKKMVARSKQSIMDALDCHVLPPPPKVFIERYADTLDLPESIEESARNEAKTRRAAGHHPSTIAAGSVYSATTGTDHTKTQEEVSNATGIHVTTIRKYYGKINDTQ